MRNIDQTYSELCHKALFSRIQEYSEPCATLVDTETWHTRNPGIFRILPNYIPTHIQNPVISTKINEYSEF